MKSSAVIACLSSLFCDFGFPSCVHSVRGSTFVSQETRTFLSARGISFSTSTATIRLGTASANGSIKPFGEPFSCCCTEVVFLSIDGRKCWPRLFTPSDRSSACLLMKRPHERLFRFPRRSMNGMALPSWLLTPGTVLLRRHVRRKADPFCDPVELVEGNPAYSVVRLPDDSNARFLPPIWLRALLLPTKARPRLTLTPPSRKLALLAALTCEMRQWMRLLTTYEVKWKVTWTLFRRNLIVNRLCSAGQPAVVNPLTVMVLMSLSLVLVLMSYCLFVFLLPSIMNGGDCGDLFVVASRAFSIVKR